MRSKLGVIATPARGIARAAARIGRGVDGGPIKRLSAGRATGVSDQMKEAANCGGLNALL